MRWDWLIQAVLSGSHVIARIQAEGLNEGGALPSTLSIIHVNDIHSHIDEFNKFGTDCRPSVLTPKPQSSDCGGGYARIKTEVDRLRQEHPHHILLNAGDEFQGTMFYTYYKGEKTAEILNQMQFDAATIGNHEFDDGPEHLAAYLKNVTVPIVCANINTSIGVLSGQLVPYTIIDRYKVGIIGLLTPETSSVSSPGDDVDFIEPLDIVQDLIDGLHAQGIHRIIALTHIGLGADMQLARETRGLSLIVGGHSHTFLGDVPWSEGPYPTLVTDLDGETVPIVTSGKWGFNLGHLQVEFKPNGRLKSWKGQPIQLLASEIKQDPDFAKKITAWKQPFLEFASEVVGYARRAFAQMTCQITECTIGNLVADSMLAAHSRADVALVNAGGLRAGIASGNITRGEVLTVLPFSSTLVDIVLTGEELHETMEGIVSWQNLKTGHQITSFVQIAGLRMMYDGSLPARSRLQKLQVYSRETESFESVDPARNYTIVTFDFLVAGGDFWWEERKGFTQQEKIDDVLIEYLRRHRTVSPQLDGRIKDVSLKGHVKAHAETILQVGHQLFELWCATFGEVGDYGLPVIEWILLTFWNQFEGAEFR